MVFFLKVISNLLDLHDHDYIFHPSVHGDGINWLETARITEVESKSVMSYKGKSQHHCCDSLWEVEVESSSIVKMEFEQITIVLRYTI